MLDALLLLIASADIYMVAQHLRAGKWHDPRDSLAVETEVFAARARIRPVGFEDELDEQVENRIGKFMKENPADYERIMNEMTLRYGGEEAGRKKFIEGIEKEERLKMQSVGPGGRMKWHFEGIEVAGESLTGRVKVVEVPWQAERPDLIRFEGDRSLVGRLLHRGPVRVGNTEAVVARVGDTSFDAVFAMEDALGPEIARLKPGSTIDILIEPTFQLTFKAKASSRLPGNVMKSAWYVRNPTTGLRCLYLNRKDPPRMFVTLAVPGRAVSEDGKTTASFWNLSGSSITILQDDVSVLCRVGGFTGNFVRVMFLILCQLMFLAALGVLAGSFLSFAVACVLAFGVLPFSLARRFLTEAVKLPKGGFAEADPFAMMGYVVMKIMSVPLPDFATTNRSDALVDGMVVTWSGMAATAGFVVAVQTAVVLALACLIFTKRELAAVQTA